MSILVAYASKHGSTRGVAERIAETLAASGQQAEARSVQDCGDLADYEGFVIGSAAYIGRWLKEASAFVLRNSEQLAQRPVWLFSSGPLGTEATDAKGQDVRVLAAPKEVAELAEVVHAREHRVFFGALFPDRLSIPEKAMRTMPAARAVMPAGDFRDWAEIDKWATTIAEQMTERMS
jgi:menaquinone-dependent protoporphyrinogen oxidase